MRTALIVAAFVVVFAAGLLYVAAPAAGQTVPPATETPTATPTATTECRGDCSIAPTPRPTTDGTPEPTATPDPNCPDGNCFPAPTPRPPHGTPAPDCPSECFPWPTPRPTYAPGATIEPANPGNGTGIWYYSFMPIMGRR